MQQDGLLQPAVHGPLAVGPGLGQARLAGVEQGDRLGDRGGGLLGGQVAAERGLDGLAGGHGADGRGDRARSAASRTATCAAASLTGSVPSTRWTSVSRLQPRLLPLGVLPRALDEAPLAGGPRRALQQLDHVREAVRPREGRRHGLRPGEQRPHLVDHAAVEHGPRALLDAAVQLGARHLERHEQGRMAGRAAPQRRRRPPGPARGRARRAPAPAPRGGGRSGGAAPRPRRGRARAGARAGRRRRRSGRDALAQARRRLGRRLELGQRGAQVEARAAGHDRHAPAGQHVVDRRARHGRVAHDVALLGRLPDGDAVVRDAGQLVGGRLVGEDRQPAVALHGVGGHDLAAEALGQRDGHRALARGRRPEEGDDGAHGVLGGDGVRDRAAQRLRRRRLDAHGDERARFEGAGDDGRLAAPRRPRQVVGSVRLGPSTSTSCTVPTSASLRRRACRWMTSTRRSRRSPLTSSGTWSGMSAASVPRRGE